MAGWNMKTVQERVEALAEQEAKKQADAAIHSIAYASGIFHDVKLTISKNMLERGKQTPQGIVVEVNRSDIADALYQEFYAHYRLENIDSISAGIIESFDRIQELTQAVEEVQHNARS